VDVLEKLCEPGADFEVADVVFGSAEEEGDP
jgi:hypothetical protein